MHQRRQVNQLDHRSVRGSSAAQRPLKRRWTGAAAWDAASSPARAGGARSRRGTVRHPPRRCATSPLGRGTGRPRQKSECRRGTQCPRPACECAPSLRQLLHGGHALSDVPELEVDGKHPLIITQRLLMATHLLAREPEKVQHANQLLFVRALDVDGALQQSGRNRILCLLHEALAERLIRPDGVGAPAQGLLELRYGLVHQTHFLECDAQIVVGLRSPRHRRSPPARA